MHLTNTLEINCRVKGRNASRFEPSRPVAQLAEQRSPKPQVGGSIPSWPAIKKAGYAMNAAQERVVNSCQKK